MVVGFSVYHGEWQHGRSCGQDSKVLACTSWYMLGALGKFKPGHTGRRTECAAEHTQTLRRAQKEIAALEAQLSSALAKLSEIDEKFCPRPASHPGPPFHAVATRAAAAPTSLQGGWRCTALTRCAGLQAEARHHFGRSLCRGEEAARCTCRTHPREPRAARRQRVGGQVRLLSHFFEPAGPSRCPVLRRACPSDPQQVADRARRTQEDPADKVHGDFPRERRGGRAEPRQERQRARAQQPCRATRRGRSRGRGRGRVAGLAPAQHCHVSGPRTCELTVSRATVEQVGSRQQPHLQSGRTAPRLSIDNNNICVPLLS
jgi:hypothetical protein